MLIGRVAHRVVHGPSPYPSHPVFPSSSSEADQSASLSSRHYHFVDLIPSRSSFLPQTPWPDSVDRPRVAFVQLRSSVVMSSAIQLRRPTTIELPSPITIKLCPLVAACSAIQLRSRPRSSRQLCLQSTSSCRFAGVKLCLLVLDVVCRIELLPCLLVLVPPPPSSCEKEAENSN